MRRCGTQEQDLVADLAAVGLDDLTGLFQPKLFCDSVF